MKRNYIQPCAQGIALHSEGNLLDGSITLSVDSSDGNKKGSTSVLSNQRPAHSIWDSAEE